MLFKIDGDSYFATIFEKKNELVLAVTDFGKGFKGSILKTEAYAAVKVRKSL